MCPGLIGSIFSFEIAFPVHDVTVLESVKIKYYSYSLNSWVTHRWHAVITIQRNWVFAMCQNYLNILKPHNYLVMKYLMLPRQCGKENWVCADLEGWECASLHGSVSGFVFLVVLTLSIDLTECLLLAQSGAGAHEKLEAHRIWRGTACLWWILQWKLPGREFENLALGKEMEPGLESETKPVLE